MNDYPKLTSCDFTHLPAATGIHDGHVHIDLPDGQTDQQKGALRTLLPIVGLNGTGKTLMLRLLAKAYDIARGGPTDCDWLPTLSSCNGDDWLHTKYALTLTDGETIEGNLFGDSWLEDYGPSRVRGLVHDMGLWKDLSAPTSREFALLRVFLPNVTSVDYEYAHSITLHYEDGTQNQVELIDFPAGMLRGLTMLTRIEDILQYGGLMLVDGLEERLDVRIVRTILDLFRSPLTNPRHAILAFTTNRPELLDHVPEAPVLALARRNDGVHALTIPPQPVEDREADWLRSNEYLADAWDGTAPKADSITALFDHMRRVAAGTGEESAHA